MKITIETDELVIRGGVLYSHGEVANEETCKWIAKGDYAYMPHKKVLYSLDHLTEYPYCGVCGKKIEVVE